MSDKTMPRGFLMLHNIGKKHNMGTVIRSASAFNFEKVFLISKQDNVFSEGIEGDVIKKKRAIRQVVKEFQMFGNQGTQQQMEFDAFRSITEAKKYFVENNIFVCGVEITPTSQSVITHPFRGDTVFLLGNEGQGLVDAHKKICDHFVYIPQYTNKTASLNVACAASIIFHHFAIWAGYEEAPIYGEKFQDQKAEEQIMPQEEENNNTEKDNTIVEEQEGKEEQQNKKETEDNQQTNNEDVTKVDSNKEGELDSKQ